MKKSRNTTSLSQKAIYLKNRITRNRRRAEFTGIIYLLATLVLTVVAFMPMMREELAPVGIFEFYKVLTPNSIRSLRTAGDLIRLVNGSLYALMLIGVVFNMLRAFSKVRWLFKKRASRTFGFNRNVYAMEDLGRIFSGSYVVILITYFLIAVICGSMAVRLRLPIILAYGVLVHLFTGFIGGKAAYFDIANGEIIEQRRLVGRFVPHIRNLLQLVTVFVGMFFFLQVCTIDTVIAPLLEKNAIQNYVVGQPLAYVSFALQCLTALWFIVLAKHATGISEWHINGPKAPGMKVFRVFTFFAFLTAGATALCRYLFGEVLFTLAEGFTVIKVQNYLDIGSLIVAGICLFTFIIEIILRKRPAIPEKDEGRKIEIMGERPTVCNPHPYSPYAREVGAPHVTVGAMQEMEDDEEDDNPPVFDGDYLDVHCPVCGKALRANSVVEYHRCPNCSKVFQIRQVGKDVIV